jgi:hypothetical protein
MLPLAMGALGAVQANDQQQMQKKQNLAAAENNRYSNWTGKTMSQRFDAPTTLGGAMQGGIGGLGMAQSFGGFGGGQDPTGALSNKPTFTNSDNFSQGNLYGGMRKNMFQA